MSLWRPYGIFLIYKVVSGTVSLNYASYIEWHYLGSRVTPGSFDVSTLTCSKNIRGVLLQLRSGSRVLDRSGSYTYIK